MNTKMNRSDSVHSEPVRGMACGGARLFWAFRSFTEAEIGPPFSALPTIPGRSRFLILCGDRLGYYSIVEGCLDANVESDMMLAWSQSTTI